MYGGAEYIQHNPLADNGFEAFIGFVNTFAEKYPDLNIEIVRVFAECDFVITHGIISGAPDVFGERGNKVVNISASTKREDRRALGRPVADRRDVTQRQPRGVRRHSRQPPRATNVRADRSRWPVRAIGARDARRWCFVTLLRHGRSPTLRVTAMNAQDSPDTIVLIHGFWVTPRSWEDWIAHYEKKGFTVLAPAYPGFEVEVEALNADPTPIEQVTVAQIMERLEGVVGGLERPPILIGHSAGGVFTQLLMDRGYGAAGVAINSAPTEGVKRVPLSQVKATFPVLKNPANRHKAVGFTFEQWQYTFTNTFPEERGRELYERYHIPASGQIFWASALANIHPGKDDTYVNYKNPDRAPLLFISGSDDHLMPPSIQHRTPSITRPRARSPRSRSSPDRTCCRRSTAGSKSPTTRWTGR